MLSVVYAMTGGVILQWLLGYNFSVAVWVGYIALYGVAVQTGVVMVVYLHEALDRADSRRRRRSPRRRLFEATVAGSVLRLRPKLMTVTATVAGAAADHVEHGGRIRRDEADRRPDHRRNDHVDDPRADHHAGDLLHHEAARFQARVVAAICRLRSRALFRAAAAVGLRDARNPPYGTKRANHKDLKRSRTNDAKVTNGTQESYKGLCECADKRPMFSWRVRSSLVPPAAQNLFVQPRRENCQTLERLPFSGISNSLVILSAEVRYAACGGVTGNPATTPGECYVHASKFSRQFHPCARTRRPLRWRCLVRP